MRVQHAPDGMRAFTRQVERAVPARSKARAPLDQLLDVTRALGDEDVHRGRVAQAVAGAIVSAACRAGESSGTDRRGDTALRVAGAAGAGIGLREHEDAAVRRKLDGGPQAGDAAADDEEVGGDAVDHSGLLS